MFNSVICLFVCLFVCFILFVYSLVPSTPVGLENQTILDNHLRNSSQFNSSTGPHLARLNEERDSKAWCTSGVNQWLEVFLGKQHTLTHIALQAIGGGQDVSSLIVQYEKTKEGSSWITYSKVVDGTPFLKVC